MITEGVQAISVQRYGVKVSAKYGPNAGFANEAEMMFDVLRKNWTGNRYFLISMLEIMACGADLDGLELPPVEDENELDSFVNELQELVLKYAEYEFERMKGT